MAAKVKRKPGESKVGLAVREMKAGQLRSGSKHGPKVTNPKQALAIGLSEQRKEKGEPKREVDTSAARNRQNKAAHRKKRNIGKG